MRAADVQIGGRYIAKVNGALTVVLIRQTHSAGGWFACNEATGRIIRIKSAARLRGEARP